MNDGVLILPLLATVLIASLLGSGHCVGMCGAFVTLVVAGDGGPSRQRLAVAYHLGRLASYAALGAIAGLLGGAFDIGGAAFGIQRSAIMLAGAMMVLIAAIMLLRAAGVRLPHIRLPAAPRRVLAALHRIAWTMRPLPRSAMIGVLTPLLPCGWLYAFVITAAGTAHPILGGLVMACFWIGTVPALAVLGLGVQWLAGPLRRHVPLATAFLLGAVGLWMLLGPATLPALANVAADRPLTTEAALVHVRELDQSTLPCCHAELDEHDE